MTRQGLESTTSGEGSKFHWGSAAMRPEMRLHGGQVEVRDQRVSCQRHEKEQGDSP